jgi:hypothetical protein
MVRTNALSVAGLNDDNHRRVFDRKSKVDEKAMLSRRWRLKEKGQKTSAKGFADEARNTGH